MKVLLETITIILSLVFLIVPWLAGFVLAKGFWITFFCIVPFYAYYLVVQFFITKLVM